MKNSFLPLILVLVFSTGLFAQQTVTNEKHERNLTQVDHQLYDVTFTDKSGDIVQEGQYWKEGNKYKPHGTWILYAYNSNEIATKAEFYRGKQLSVETKVNGEYVRADNNHLTAKQ